MQIIDIIIIALLVLGLIIGFKRGFIRQTVSLVGFILVIILAFMFRFPVSEFMYENLPFMSFNFLLKGAPVLNILVYEAIAFLVLLALLMVLLKIVLIVSSIFEKILDLTIILALPSKILGALVGVVQFYLVAFIFLFILSLSLIELPFSTESKYKNNILNKTPILSPLTDKTQEVLEEFKEIKDMYVENDNTKEFNEKAFRLMLENKIVTPETLMELAEDNKLGIEILDLEKILIEYR